MTYKSKNKQLPISVWNIKSMPIENTPDEKLYKFGGEMLGDAELLAIIIRTGLKGSNSVNVAQDIINHAGKDGLLGLCKMDIKELEQIQGIGRVKATQIKAVAELAKRISKRSAKDKIIIDSPRTVADYFMEDLRHRDKECLMMLCMDGRGALLSESLISVGTVNSSLAMPREVFVEALRRKAVSIIILHNHPSGDPSPSNNDILATKRIKEAGEIIGISLLDHIIIGDNIYVSMNEEKMM